MTALQNKKRVVSIWKHQHTYIIVNRKIREVIKYGVRRK
jgi:hypothetical protein